MEEAVGTADVSPPWLTSRDKGEEATAKRFTAVVEASGRGGGMPLWTWWCGRRGCLYRERDRRTVGTVAAVDTAAETVELLPPWF